MWRISSNAFKTTWFANLQFTISPTLCYFVDCGFIHFDTKCTPAICSTNFQNVKLRPLFVEMWIFYRYYNFTWNQISASLNSPKLPYLAILEVLNFDFSKFEQLSGPNFTKIQSSESLKLPKMTFLDHLNLPKLDFT